MTTDFKFLLSVTNSIRFFFRMFALSALFLCYTAQAAAPEATGTPTLFPQTAPLEISAAPAPNGTLSVTGQALGLNTNLDPGRISLSITGGVGPYKIAWSNMATPQYSNVINAMNNQLQESDSIELDTARIRSQIDSLTSVTENTGLMPNVYYARIEDMQGNFTVLGAVVPRHIDWYSAPQSAIVNNVMSPQKIIQGVTWLPTESMSVTKTSGQGLQTGYTISQELFYPEDYHYIELEGPVAGPEIRSGLALVDPQNPASLTDMPYYFRFANGQVSLVGNGQPIGQPLPYAPGDLFGLEVRDGLVTFYRNYVSMMPQGAIALVAGSAYQYKNMLTAAGSTIAYLKVVSVGGTLPVTGTSPAATFRDRINASITDVTCANSCVGAITATIAPAYFMSGDLTSRPYSFELFQVSNGVPAATPIVSRMGVSSWSTTFSNLCAGNYMVRAAFYRTGRLTTLTEFFTVAYLPDWLAVINTSVTPSDRTLRKTFVSDNCDAGAYSANELAYSTAAEWFEFGISSSSGYYADDMAAGFTEPSGDLSSTASTKIQYGLAFNFDSPFGSTFPSTIPVLGSGTATLTVGFSSTKGWFYVFVNTFPAHAYMGVAFDIADRFKIEKTGSVLRFYKNNVLLSTPASYSLTTTAPMRADVSLCGQYTVLVKPRLTFGCFTPLYASLRKEMDGHCYRADRNQVYFRYDEEYQDADRKLQFTIYNDQHYVVSSSATISPSLVPVVYYGDNRYGLDLNNTAYTGGTLLSPGYYLLEVVNEKKESWYLRFQK